MIWQSFSVNCLISRVQYISSTSVYTNCAYMKLTLEFHILCETVNKWKCPECVCELQEVHHQPKTSPKSHRNVRRMLYLLHAFCSTSLYSGQCRYAVLFEAQSHSGKELAVSCIRDGCVWGPYVSSFLISLWPQKRDLHHAQLCKQCWNSLLHKHIEKKLLCTRSHTHIHTHT